jgi:hypothetical protein
MREAPPYGDSGPLVVKLSSSICRSAMRSFDLVEFTLFKAYVGADRLNDARRMLSVRRRGSSSLPVAGLATVH